MQTEIKEKEKDNLSDSSHDIKKKAYSAIFEAAFIITAITAISSLVGLTYYEQFFNRLALPNIGLKFNPVFYIQESFNYSFFIFISIIISFAFTLKKTKGYVSYFISNLFIPFSLLIMLATKGQLIYLATDLKITHFEFWFMVLSWVWAIYYSYKKKSFIQTVFINGNLYKKGLFVFCYVGVLIYNSGLVGIYHAEQIISGKFYSSMIVNLELKDGKTFKPNDELILIMHHQNKYYMTEKKDNPPYSPNIYIIPECEVKVATVRRVSNGKSVTNKKKNKD